jgi:membrane-bound metal-dependent hydrolase YbcI (DUF457 family)
VPVTPFHFGPGLLFRALSKRIDFWSFAAANVVIDLESGWNMVRRSWPVHRFLHTFLGASLAILPAAIAGFVAWRLLRRLGAVTAASPGVAALLAGAALGAWTHVLLDAVMHADVRPFHPWSDANPLLDRMSARTLVGACVAAAVVGGALLLYRLRRHADR